MTNIQQFDFNIDLMRAILWQYNSAEKLQSLLLSKKTWTDTYYSGFWNDWYRDVFNVETANEFGLSVWAIILGLPLYVSTPAEAARDAFGFDANENFFNSTFAAVSETVGLPLETMRIAIKLRYHQLTCSTTIPETNRMLKRIFGDRGPAYLLDGEDMTQTYVFMFEIGAQLRYLFDNFDILPRPASVKSNYIIGTKKAFGFGQYNVNFNNGTFAE